MLYMVIKLLSNHFEIDYSGEMDVCCDFNGMAEERTGKEPIYF